MSLVQHAQRELELAGLFDKNSDYDGGIAKAVMQLMRVFAKQGHSGFSAHQTLLIFLKLSNFENLTPITSNPEDWEDRSDICGEPMWQCKRNPALFSTDGGKTWYSSMRYKQVRKWWQIWKRK